MFIAFVVLALFVGAAAFAQQPNRGEQVMKTLARAYPDRIGPAELRNDDWAVSLGGQWYYYAEGRLLPENLKGRIGDYDPLPFYRYPAEMPPWQAPGPEDRERMQNMDRQRRLHPAKRSSYFYDALWRAHSKEESWDRVKSIRFLGKPVMVHYAIMEELALVEERIVREAKTNAAVRQWVNSLQTVEAWNWRDIAATQSRSFHAYGSALDLLPRSRGGLETYWLWTARSKPEWWMTPYNKRLHPPQEVIKAFESFGFIWGGKWLFFDTMHFEYRPEILLLNDIPQADLRRDLR
jgi:hypothetical protein